MDIQCESPVYILSPHIRDLVLKYRHYYINNKRYSIRSHWYTEFPYNKFSKIKKYLVASEKYPTPISLDSCYVVDAAGVCQPLFMQVPCGKCILCRDKKAREWECRAMCESQTSSSMPYFITLTYNDRCLPRNGVRKGAAQRFMKRLRINFERYTGQKHNIRFFLCSEYGSKTGRPHYHALLWNMPILQQNHILDIIEKSWSFSVSKEYYDKVPDDLDQYKRPIYKFYDDEKDTYRCRYGYVYCSEITQGRVRYCMKYMRKDNEVPKGMKDIFFLSSRRGGLGKEWIMQFCDEYRNNPQYTNIQLYDKWSGKLYKGCIPRYFKDFIAPPPSKLVSKVIRDMLTYWNYAHNKACSLIGFHYSPNPLVLKKYPFFVFHSYHVKTTPNLCDTDEEYQEYCRDTFQLVDNIEHELLEYDYDVELAERVQVYKEYHQSALCWLITTLPTISVKDKCNQIRKKQTLSRSREKI